MTSKNNLSCGTVSENLNINDITVCQKPPKSRFQQNVLAKN